MKKTYKHKKLGWIATQRVGSNISGSYNYYEVRGKYEASLVNRLLDIELVENSNDWQEITIAKCCNCGKEIIVQECKDCSCIEKIWVRRKDLTNLGTLPQFTFLVSWLINKRDLGQTGNVPYYKAISMDGKEVQANVVSTHNLIQCTEYEAHNWFKKKALFITEDGKEMYKEDRPWYIDKDLKLSGTADLIKNAIWHPATGYKYFSTKEAAEFYIEENKPRFSRKQIRDALSCITYNQRESIYSELNMRKG